MVDISGKKVALVKGSTFYNSNVNSLLPWCLNTDIIKKQLKNSVFFFIKNNKEERFFLDYLPAG